MKRLLFRKQQRIKTNQQFRSILEQQNCLRNKFLSLYYVQNDCGFARLGVSVPKSIGNAVIRNRLKRYIRESFRTQQHEIPQNLDYLVMVNKKPGRKTDNKPAEAAKQITSADVKDSFLKLATQAAENTS